LGLRLWTRCRGWRTLCRCDSGLGGRSGRLFWDRAGCLSRRCFTHPFRTPRGWRGFFGFIHIVVITSIVAGLFPGVSIIGILIVLPCCGLWIISILIVLPRRRIGICIGIINVLIVSRISIIRILAIFASIRICIGIISIGISVGVRFCSSVQNILKMLVIIVLEHIWHRILGNIIEDFLLPSFIINDR
jgi:hypothetical protein